MKWLFYSLKSLRCVKPIFIYLSLFGLVPFFNFDTFEIKYVKIQTFYYFSLAVFFIYLKYLTFIDLSKFTSGLYASTDASAYDKFSLSITYINVFLLLLTIGSIFYTSLFKRNKWRFLMQELLNINNSIYWYHYDADTSKIWKSPLGIFLLHNLTIWSFCIFAFIDSVRRTNLVFIALYYFISAIILSYIMFLICLLSLIISTKYDMIEETVLKGEKVLDVNRFLRKSRKFFMKMNEIVKTFNSLFGTSILSALFYYGISFVYRISRLYIAYKETGEMPYASVSRILLAIWKFLNCICLFMCGDCAFGKREKLKKTCLLLKRKLHYSSERYKELDDFYQQINHQQVKFSAAKLFNLDQATLIIFLNLLFTYFVVYVQF